MSLTSLLSIARTALLTQQRAIDTTGHNIANASTEGYTRQRLNLTAEVPLQTGNGQVGRGVTADGIQRLRDGFLDQTYRRENGDLGRFSTLRDLLGQAEGIFGEPSDSGIGAGVDQLLSAFGDLANDPTSSSARSLVRQAGTNLARQFSQADTRMSAVTGEVRSRMEGAVQDINSITAQIADLNVQVRSAGAGFRESPDLKDKRDKLVDQLSGMVGVRVLQRNDGTVGIIAGDALLVDGGQATALEVRDDGTGRLAVGVAGSGGTVNPQSGSLAALVELAGKTLPDLRARLDGLVAGIVQEVNALHRAGRGLNGATGVDFFDPTGRTADSMALSPAVALDTDNIAAGQSGAPGDNLTALAIAGLRTTGVAAFGGSTIGGAFQRLVSEVAVAVQDATSRSEAQDVITTHADTLRQSMSGVSVDEELTTLIGQQNAYAAAARLVNVADEMVQELLAMVQ